MNAARLVHEQQLATATVKNLYAGDCRGCGECCSRFLPLAAFDVERIETYIEGYGVEQQPERGDIDLTCPYLTDERMCAIYEARPDICRCYRCDEHARGDFRLQPFFMRHGPYYPCDMREVF